MVNLFSISKSLLNGWSISNKGVEIKLSKGKSKTVFDRTIKTSKGLVVGVKIVSRTDDLANVMLDRRKSIDISVLHGVLGHPSEDITKKTADYYGWKITGKFKPCYDRQTAKSKQNAVPNESETKSIIPGERLYIDTSSVKAKTFGGSKFWLLVVDDCTDVAWSAFLNKKGDQVERLITLIKELAIKHKVSVKYIRCDNASENGALEKECTKQGLGIQFKNTQAPEHPNSMDEWKESLSPCTPRYQQCSTEPGCPLSNAKVSGLKQHEQPHILKTFGLNKKANRILQCVLRERTPWPTKHENLWRDCNRK
jgi:hypothetical protein